MTLTAACGGSSERSATGAVVSPRWPVATAGRACTAADLSAVFLRRDGATGKVVLSFALRNRGTATCHTYGWPGVEFLGAGGRGLQTQSRRVTRDMLGATPASVITLTPGRWASFRVIATDHRSRRDAARCRLAHALQIAVPGDAGRIRIEIPGGAYECSTATVSALQAGDAASG